MEANYMWVQNRYCSKITPKHLTVELEAEEMRFIFISSPTPKSFAGHHHDNNELKMKQATKHINKPVNGLDQYTLMMEIQHVGLSDVFKMHVIWLIVWLNWIQLIIKGREQREIWVRGGKPALDWVYFTESVIVVTELLKLTLLWVKLTHFVRLKSFSGVGT